MNSIWNKNIQLFKSRFPALAELYNSIIEDISTNGDEKNIFSFWTVKPAKNGSLTAQIDNMLLHSSYNPEREGQTAAEQLVSKNKETVIFMGAGLGWQLCALARLITKSVSECPVKKIVLVEPDPIHFFAALFYIDWSDVFAVEQLVMAIGCPADSVIPLLEGNSINTANAGVSAAYVYAIPAFILHARPYFDSVISLIERNRNKNEINAATYKKFEKLWIRNSIKNIPHIQECKSVISYVKDNDIKAENCVLVAAGPSLEKLLPQMAQIKKHAVIVCVETALHAMLRAGVEPDFIVITDPQYYAYRHIAGLSSPSSVLVCPLSVYPDVFNFSCRQIILCSEMLPVSGFFERVLGSFGDLGAGGSVASSAWSLCRLLGAKNIYLAGLDLSYPMGQTHIKGSSAEQAGHLSSSRVSPVQQINSRTRFSANPEYSVDYNGNKVLTDSRMKMFAWWFESKIAECKDVKTYTLCAESMKIPGVEIAAEVVSTSSTTTNRYSITTKDISSIISSFLTELNTLTTLINQAVEKCIIAGPNLLSELSLIEQKIAESPLEQIIALARPVTDDRLEMYKALQKTMGIYNKYIIYYNTGK